MNGIVALLMLLAGHGVEVDLDTWSGERIMAYLLRTPEWRSAVVGGKSGGGRGRDGTLHNLDVLRRYGVVMSQMKSRCRGDGP